MNANVIDHLERPDPTTAAQHGVDADVDIVIAGAGPCGLTLANQLGALGIRVLVLEKLPTLIDYPRSVGVDDEALRSFQAIGLVEAVRRHTVPNQIMRFVDAEGRVLAAIAPTAQPFGWPRRSGFIQPLVDRELAAGLKRFPQVELRFCAAFEGCRCGRGRASTPASATRRISPGSSRSSSNAAPAMRCSTPTRRNATAMPAR